MSSENSELVMLRLNYDIQKLKHFLYLAEQSQKEASEIIAELKAENTKLKEKLEEIKELATPLCCNNPFDCWMNKDDGTGDIYGCEGDDYKGCPNGFASCVLKIIEGAEDA